MSLFALEDLEAGYGPIRVLHGINLCVGVGEVVALLGRNGAGKSTTLKASVGLARVFSGRVVYRDRDITTWPAHRRVRAGLGYIPEDRRIFPELTVRENLEIGGKMSLSRHAAWNLDRIYERMSWLQEIERRRGGFLSGGEQQMLTIARTLMGNPELLLLDEPTEGLAPQFVRFVANLVLELKRAGTAVLLAEQNLRFVSRLADRVYVLESGELRLEGGMGEMAENEQVKTLLAL